MKRLSQIYLAVAVAAISIATASIQPLAQPGPDPTIEAHKLGSVLGIEVRTTAERNIGRIVDLLADRGGRIQAAVIEFGGFLGMGSRKIAVEWSALRLEATGKQTVAILDMTRDQLRTAPEYKAEQPVVLRKGGPSPSEAETAPPEEPTSVKSTHVKQAPAARQKRKRTHKSE